jgi:hypothetical protein
MFSQQRLLSRIRASDLCQRDTPMPTAWQAIGWWETRRVAFNLIVGSAGTISSVLVGVVGLGSYFLFDSDFGVPDPPLFALFAVVIYAIMANVCYTGGWVAELVIRKAWPEQADRFAALSLALGVVVGKCVSTDQAVFSVRNPPAGSWGNIGPS